MTKPGADDKVALGRINGVWGTRGWIKVFSDTDPPEAIFDYQPWMLDQSEEALSVAEWRRQGPRLVARVTGIDSTEQAAGLIGRSLSVRRKDLPPPEPDRYYWSDLIGLEVINLEGHVYGKIQRLVETGSNDVIEASGEQGTTMIPFIPELYVKSVDLVGGKVTVDWPLDWVDEADAEQD